MLAPGGVIAARTYPLFRTTPPVDAVIERFASTVVGAFWPPERRHVDAGYADLAFPFEAVEAPEFVMGVSWRLERVLACVETWSAVGGSGPPTGSARLRTLNRSYVTPGERATVRERSAGTWR